ncbi:MAG: type IV pilus twitching motility protein PilT [Blastocatellia bacterium]|nr:type IV pilus twitching motility protein PilT [Blastocatellia bacterium]
MPTIDDLLGIAVREGASDLHLKAGCLPAIRVNGEIRPVRTWPRLTQENTLTISFAVMNNKQKERFKENAEIDVAYSVPGLGRFRCNIHQQRGTVGLVFRIIATGVKSAEDLKLPKVINQIAEERRGLVLVTGATGSGKSTTLAAIIDQINVTRSCTIITIEDPIEFLHKDKKSFVIQREIDVDAVSFKSALRGALRQDPDVILVGEMRDYETIETALTAAETGHLVLSTLHTLDATETIQRIVSVFPPHQQQGIRLQLASVLRAIVSMRLVRADDGKARVPAVEVMRSTEFIRECIAYPEKTRHMREAIAKGRSQYGMQTFDQSLYDLFRLGLITYQEAVLSATNPEDLKLQLTGFVTAGSEAEMREAHTAKG